MKLFIFLKLYLYVYLRTKFQVSIIILTSFRQGVILSPHTSKRTPKKPTQIRINKKTDKNALRF